MKANEALKILRISKSTLTKYTKTGLIHATKLPTGRYDYNEQSIYQFLNKGVQRKTVVYARVSTSKQKKDLSNQVELLKNYCLHNGIQINQIYQDVASGISFEKRKDFFLLLDEVFDNKIEKIIITYKDRLSRVGFDLFYYLFQKFGTEIVVMSEAGSTKLDSEEIFEEIVSLLHCYSMKLYSKRKKKIVKELICE